METSTKSSRRSLIRTAAKLAIAAPIALTILPAVAAADGDDHGDPEDRGRGRKLGLLCRPGGDVNAANIQNGMSLVPVSQVNGGANSNDFNASSPGSDALAGGGAVAVAGNHQVLVMLQGGVGNSTYDVQFVRLHDDGREDLGSFTTDANGNFNGAAPNALGATNRVGAFVLIRNGADEYVSAWA